MLNVAQHCTVVVALLYLAVGTGVVIAQPTSSPAEPSAAIPIGSWRTHLSYRNLQHLALTPERIYGVATNGLMYVDRSDNSLRLLSKNDGLSDAGVITMAYNPSSEALALAYRSGQIDVLIRNQVIPFSLIREASQDRPESIYALHWQGDSLWVCSSEGVRLLVVENSESPTVRIQASYTQLGSEGASLAVFDATTTPDSIFLATQEGVIANTLAPAVNRQDFNTWRRFTPANLPVADVRYVAYRAGQTYAALDGEGLFRYQAGRWAATAFTTSQAFRALRATSSGLIAVLDRQVVVLSDQETLTVVDDELITQPHDALVDEQGVIWIADQQHGLVRGEPGQPFSSFIPDGPYSDSISDVRFVNEQIVTLDGGTNGTFSVLNQRQWVTHQVPFISSSLSDIAFSPSTDTYYLSTRGDGLVQWDGEQQFAPILLPGESTPSSTLSSLAVQNERLWVARRDDVPSLLALSPSEDAWQSFSLSSLGTAPPLRMIVDFSGYKWIITGTSDDLASAGSDMLVFDDQEAQEQTVRSVVGSANLPGSQITDLVLDQDGLIWIGGNQGIAYFPNPFGIFSDVTVVKPVFDRQFLLRDEYVTSLAVDGGNRKWVGTLNGLWLFSETGEELIHHFTTDNSPLLSDTILDIAINDLDGEIFIATDQGMISYRSTATQSSLVHQSVKVFPNPVRQGFDGTVGIQGLASDATVKITTISGTLVQELQAEGGTAAWDARSYTGQRASTGVYLLFSATANGEETYVGKFAIIP